MPGEYKEDKTEKATPKKRNKARNQGKVAQSQELGTVAVLFFSGIGLLLFGGSIMRFLIVTMRFFLRTSGEAVVNAKWVAGTYSMIFVGMMSALAPILAVLVVAGLGVHFMQVGFLFTTKALKPKLSAIKPSLKKLNFFSKEKLLKLGISMGKIFIVSYVAYKTIRGEADNFFPLMDQTLGQMWIFLCGTAFKIIMRVCVLLLLLAIIDYIYQRHKHEEDLKMTKQEVKDERRMIEGDPKVKSHIRAKMRELGFQRMMSNVPNADVVITNPVTYAVAVKYDSELMMAPKVVAKGARLVAERIKEIAQMNNIPIVENKPLAQALFKLVEVGFFIPLSFYKVVAEILAYVYRLKGKTVDVN